MEIVATVQRVLPAASPLTVAVALLAVCAAAYQLLFARPAMPAKAPRLLAGWPVVGSVDFFRARATFLQFGKDWGRRGLFAFYYGPHRIVSLSSDADRKLFFSHRALDISAGYAALFAGAPDAKHLGEEDNVDLTSERFATLFKRFLVKPRLDGCVAPLVADTLAAIALFDADKPMDPFDIMYKLIYQLTHRTLGCDDVADDPALCAETLSMFSDLHATGALEVMFPWLPTPVRVRKLWGGARMHWTLQRIMKQRRESGRPGTDAMQTMMDAGDTDLQITTASPSPFFPLLLPRFIMAALFTGVINSGVNAAWIPVYLAQNEEWRARVQGEIDASLAKYRRGPDETPTDILPRLTPNDWDNDFPSIDLVLRECIRINLCGSFLRKNTSGKDVDIPGTDYVIPRNTFAVYLLDYVHMNPDVYADPTEFDPARYLPGREEHKKVPHAFLGWGAGLHPCLGMRFAKLEMAMLTVTLMACFDFDLCDKQGNPRTTPIPRTDRNWLAMRPIVGDMYLKLKRKY